MNKLNALLFKHYSADRSEETLVIISFHNYENLNETTDSYDETLFRKLWLQLIRQHLSIKER